MQKNQLRQNIKVRTYKDTDRIDLNKDFIRMEGFNTLRNNVRICLKKDTNNKILITSPLAGEGKSTCSCNLALSIAKTEKKVIIIDCDLRKPVIHKTFELSNKLGLTDLLSSLTDLSGAIQKTSCENLFILSAGRSVPNPSALLSGEEIRSIIHDLEKKFEYIILDCPPINVVADAIPLFGIVDGMVLVIRKGTTKHPDLQKALSTIKFTNANIFGIFMYDKIGSDKDNRKYYEKYGSYYNNT